MRKLVCFVFLSFLIVGEWDWVYVVSLIGYIFFWVYCFRDRRFIEVLGRRLSVL